MEEVTKQIQPLANKMDKMHEWQLAFWSNGSGRPPGFFQMRMKEDDERNKKINDDMTRGTEVADRMDDFIKAALTLQKHKEERWARWWPVIKWVGGGMGTAILGLIVWAGTHFAPIVKVLWQDYLKYHPNVTEQLKNVRGANEPALSSKQQSQEDAGGPTGAK